MGVSDFIGQLRSLGYEPQDIGSNRVAMPLEIPVGRFAGTQISLGIEVPPDFPMSPPGGPHVKPHLLPINQTSGAHPACAVHPSPFGSEWQYWSRPFQNWSTTDRTARTYMAHINHLFDTQ